MALITDDRIDLTNPQFRAVLLKTLANDGLVSYKLKCLAICAAAVMLGFAHAYALGVYDLFIHDIFAFVIPIMGGIALALVFYVCKQMDITLEKLNKTFVKSETDFKRFVYRWNRQSPFFYYLCIGVFVISCLAASALAFFPATYGFTSPSPWIGKLVENGSVGLPTYVYFFFSNFLLGITLGIGFNRILYCVRILDNYGKSFISFDKIDLHWASTPEELTWLARLAVKIDMIVAVPTTICTLIFLQSLVAGVVNIVMLIFLVACILLFFFFSIFPLRHFHRELVKTKRLLIEDLNHTLQHVGKRSTLGIREHADIIIVKNHVKNMSTWGIDTGLLVRFLFAGLLPLVLGALLQIILERILP